MLFKTNDVMIVIKDGTNEEEIGFNIINDGEDCIFEITKEEAEKLKEKLEKALKQLDNSN
ncbi:hypothetical protein [Methanocaldococcus fervens]|uniref:Uncharacterized protein n=1 Tax=Methanocaldococcus fervens (strain DSM 4213 / JCM 15782 / AG86) TaxID=573064 RepID=C7P9R3_METFA|nr:hypothetical protein [Methanocaldococcus fervens]ACV25420.1 hypothetical protein Mefer_1617 [Methanocaldococcus fervens AG86]